MFKSDCTPRSQSSGVTHNIIPGCSAVERDNDSPVIISNTMLQAYNSMRGPAAKDSQEDPLFEWIHLREDVRSRNGKPTKARRSKRDILNMLHKVDETLSEGNAAGDSPREAVFEIDRPVTADHHIRAPPNHDFSLHALAACCDKRGFDSDSEDSDEDSAVPHGRISPCTFLAWSKGCQRWSGDSIKEPIDAKQPRRRPPTPEVGDTSPSVPRPFRSAGWNIERQVDDSTGYELSPSYEVPTSPSLLYVPEGVDFVRSQDPAAFEGRYSRMDPMAGKLLRRLLCYRCPKGPGGVDSTPIASPTTTDAEIEKYGHSEVADILNSPSAQPPHGQKPGSITPQAYLDKHFNQAYAAIAAHEAQAEGLTNILRNQTAQIRELREVRERLSAAVGIVKSRRRQRKRLEEEEKLQQQKLYSQTPEGKRRKQIHKHVAAHLEDVQFKFHRAENTLGIEQRRKKSNENTIANLEKHIADLCREAGLDNPAEVYHELMENDDLEDEEQDNVAATPSCEKNQAQPHQHRVDHSEINGRDAHEGGRCSGGSGSGGRSKARDNIPPTIPPLLVTANRIVHPPALHSRAEPTPHQHVSQSPLIQAGAIPLGHPHPHNGGQFEDDPLPRLKSQYADIMETYYRGDSQSNSRIVSYSYSNGCAIVDDDEEDENNDTNNHNQNGYIMDASRTKNKYFPETNGLRGGTS
ncbi:uncharacterized protein PG998_009815 [Apiospora kogelbergensis]|uniref:uncharacterized protein n=1 Tax=Apiospora kogelbergensis TaxID=1337665 RepID=UPI00312D8F96